MQYSGSRDGRELTLPTGSPLPIAIGMALEDRPTLREVCDFSMTLWDDADGIAYGGIVYGGIVYGGVVRVPGPIAGIRLDSLGSGAPRTQL